MKQRLKILAAVLCLSFVPHLASAQQREVASAPQREAPKPALLIIFTFVTGSSGTTPNTTVVSSIEFSNKDNCSAALKAINPAGGGMPTGHTAFIHGFCVDK
jgi:hypothetical protein